MYQGARWIIAVALAGAGLCGASAQAAIKIEQATAQNGVAFVSGNGAVKGALITWEGFAVTTANKNNGGFSFVGVLPADCSGALSDGASSVAVAVLGCTIDGCQADLATCTTSLSSTQSQLTSCTTDKNTCTTNLTTCTMDLAACEAAPPAPVAQTGQTVCYDSAGTVIPCSGTGQDGELQQGVASPTPRFTKNVNVADDTGAGGGTTGNGICDGSETCNGTVTDHLTGLIWLQNANCANAVRNWATALSDVASLNTAGTMNGNNCGDTSNAGSNQIDWRLPNLRELQSLVDYGTSTSPVLPAGHPFTNFQASVYWSSTSFAPSPSVAWVVGFGNGLVGFGNRALSDFVAAVRGGS